jgi:hypothetical protein
VVTVTSSEANPVIVGYKPVTTVTKPVDSVFNIS